MTRQLTKMETIGAITILMGATLLFITEPRAYIPGILLILMGVKSVFNR